MRERDWPEVDMCDVCYALIPRVLKGAHEEWHARVVSESIRVGNAVDRIRRT